MTGGGGWRLGGWSVFIKFTDQSKPITKMQSKTNVCAEKNHFLSRSSAKLKFVDIVSFKNEPPKPNSNSIQPMGCAQNSTSEKFLINYLTRRCSCKRLFLRIW